MAEFGLAPLPEAKGSAKGGVQRAAQGGPQGGAGMATALGQELARQTRPALRLLEACARDEAAGAARVARLRAALQRLPEAPPDSDSAQPPPHGDWITQHTGELRRLAQLLEQAPAMAARARLALARLEGLAARAAACEQAAAKLRAEAEAAVRAAAERRERESALDASVRVAADDATQRRPRQAASKTTVRKKHVELDL
jgi:hypothetical protein